MAAPASRVRVREEFETDVKTLAVLRPRSAGMFEDAFKT